MRTATVRRSERHDLQAILPASTADRGRALLETHLDLIQRRLRTLSWRGGLPESEAEEFRSWALFKLVDDGYRILGSWQGRSSFSTFLTAVLVNLLRDYRDHLWGKWRSSAASRRGGQAGVLLERLVVRDGLSSEESVERLRTEHGIVLSQEEVARLTAALPRRLERRWAGVEELIQIPVDGRVEARVKERERARTARRLRELLVPLLRSLSAEERVLLKLYFFDDLSMAAISRKMGRPQRDLYSARDRCLRKVQRHLALAGLGREDVGELLDDLQRDLGLEAQLTA
jgi:RNA polymerase sigma factor (sigma-70 family)